MRKGTSIRLPSSVSTSRDDYAIFLQELWNDYSNSTYNCVPYFALSNQPPRKVG